MQSMRSQHFQLKSFFSRSCCCRVMPCLPGRPTYGSRSLGTVQLDEPHSRHSAVWNLCSRHSAVLVLWADVLPLLSGVHFLTARAVLCHSPGSTLPRFEGRVSARCAIQQLCMGRQGLVTLPSFGLDFGSASPVPPHRAPFPSSVGRPCALLSLWNRSSAHQILKLAGRSAFFYGSASDPHALAPVRRLAENADRFYSVSQFRTGHCMRCASATRRICSKANRPSQGFGCEAQSKTLDVRQFPHPTMSPREPLVWTMQVVLLE